MKLEAEELEGGIDFFNPRNTLIPVIAIVGYGKGHICGTNMLGLSGTQK